MANIDLAQIVKLGKTGCLRERIVDCNGDRIFQVVR